MMMGQQLFFNSDAIIEGFSNANFWLVFLRFSLVFLDVFLSFFISHFFLIFFDFFTVFFPIFITWFFFFLAFPSFFYKSIFHIYSIFSIVFRLSKVFLNLSPFSNFPKYSHQIPEQKSVEISFQHSTQLKTYKF